MSEKSLLEKGRYIAIAADCNACHRSSNNNGADFSGGYIIQSPMGNIIASNITPSINFGIGKYTEKDFVKALREGINREGESLYPAMPYTSYKGMTDEDIHALYYYIMHGVTPVEQDVPTTKLSFPFNVRQSMKIWNWLYLDKSLPLSNQENELLRGKYLVKALAHCGTCHTPRNMMMAEKEQDFLAGTSLAGWYAPNITSDRISGIGGWHNDELVTYLKTGHVKNKAQAAGAMAEAIERSFSKLTEHDIHAIVSYLYTSKPIREPRQQTPAYAQSTAQTLALDKIEFGQGDQSSLFTSNSLDGALLYNSACASCHGINGQGTQDDFYPSLTNNNATGGIHSNNLVMVILNGLNRKWAEGETSMPAFANQLTTKQVASIANYVTTQFGNPSLHVTEKEVISWQQGGEKPFIVVAIPYIIAVIIIIIIVVIFCCLPRKKKSN